MPELIHHLPHILWHCLLHVLRLVPFLFCSYWLMEYVEHKAQSRAGRWMSRVGPWGPLAGALCGLVPQCGFSASAAGLFAGGLISLGTLTAVFLSTSDEMLVILLSNLTPLGTVAKILGLKLGLALLAGFLLDAVFGRMKGRGADHKHSVEHLCHQEGCGCHEKPLWRSALTHTLEVSLFLLAVTLALELVLELVGEAALGTFLTSFPLVGPLLAALVGLIPNCASSVLLTQLWLRGALSAGSLIGGLLTGSGIGLLVLFKTNRPMKDNLFLLLFLFLFGALCGLVLDTLGLIL